MDGLSGAASGIAVVSLAIQLGDSTKKLCEFWTSVKEAPDDVRAITANLQLLSSVLAEIASEEQHFEPDPTLGTALRACRDNVIKLVRIADDMEPGFVSKKPRVRIWTAFKAAIKSESIQKSRKILEGLKSTLTLALQNHHNRVNRIRHQIQQQDITTILRHLSNLNLDQTIAFRHEASRFHQTIHNPIQGVGLEVSRDVAVQNVAKYLPRDQSRKIGSPPNAENIHSTHGYRKSPPRARQQSWKSYYCGLTKTFFGAMTHTIKTTSLKSGLVMDDILNDEEYPYELEESYKILPAGWLLKLGFNCAYNFSIHDSSTKGWQFSIKPINLVPNDAPIFQYCEQGNVEMVRDLMSRNLASVRDVDSEGQTALHFAARARSPELCRFLIEAGADKSARTFVVYSDPDWNERTPLRELTTFPITQDGLVDAIDTCRIFDDSYDFWDGFGDGWAVLNGFMRLGRRSDDEALAEFSSWFVQSSSPDIKTYYDKDHVSNTIFLSSCGMLDSISLLLELGPPGTVDHQSFGRRSLHESIICREYDKTRLLLACGADPHRLNFWSFSNRVESPLSLAMSDPWAFCSVRDALMEMSFHVEDIVRRELEQGRPLLDDGWQAETLSALLKLSFELEIEPSKDLNECSNCGFTFLGGELMVQRYWQDILERIKNGTYVQNDRSDTQDVQSSSSQSHSSNTNTVSLTDTTASSSLSHDLALSDNQSTQSGEDQVGTENAISRLVPGDEETWCLDCWRHFKRTGRLRSPHITETTSSDGEDSSEDDFSPFLFNT